MAIKSRCTIGVLSGNAISDHMEDFINGICQAAEEKGVKVLFFLGAHNILESGEEHWHSDSEKHNHQYNRIYDYAGMGDVDALIIPGGTIRLFPDQGSREELLHKFDGIPYILAKEKKAGSSYIISENISGMRECVEHLIKYHGYHKIVFMGGPVGNTDAEERLETYLRVMEENGLRVTDDMFEHGDYSTNVTRQIENLLTHHPDTEAIVCANDDMAQACYTVCEQRGLIIGKDIAITGYDDCKYAKYMQPPLTTVKQDSRLLGYKALLLADAVIRGDTADSQVMKAAFCCRNSCGCTKSVSTVRNTVYMNEISHRREFSRKMWAVPFMAENLAECMEDQQQFYCEILRTLYQSGSRRTYLYLLEKPVIPTREEPWKCPETLLRVARQIEAEPEIFEDAKRMQIHKGEGLLEEMEADCGNLFLFNLFSGKKQFGVLMCDIEIGDIQLFNFLCMQIGSALLYRETLTMLNEKNEVLSFISEYDELTGCLNRRGFIERALEIIRENKGKEATLIYGDLDHLKEINDTYGHIEGDYAIRNAARILKDTIGENSIVARIGGDEFVAIVLQAGDLYGKKIVDAVRSSYEKLNQKSDKPYYIEMSVGVDCFHCSENISLVSILNQADRVLYEAKKRRRDTIRR